MKYYARVCMFYVFILIMHWLFVIGIGIVYMYSQLCFKNFYLQATGTWEIYVHVHVCAWVQFYL